MRTHHAPTALLAATVAFLALAMLSVTPMPAQGANRDWREPGAASNGWYSAANWGLIFPSIANPDDSLFIGLDDVAGVSSNNVDINNGGRIAISQNAVVTLRNIDIDYGQIEISDTADVTFNDVDMNDGQVEISNSAVVTFNDIDMNDGQVEISNSAVVTFNDVEISSGRIEISGTPVVTFGSLGIGDVGTGALQMNGGMLTTDTAFIGRNWFGTANINGSNSLWNISNGISSDLFVGFLGEGRLNITGGADVNVEDDGFIGGSALGSGAVDVSGFGSRLNFTGIDSTLIVGSGNGTLNITNRATVLNDDSIIGQGGGSIGKVTIDSGGTWTNTGSMTVGFNGTGTLEIRGGGTATSTGSGTIGFSVAAGRVLVDGSGSLWDIASTLKVGDFTSGQLEISGGGRVENTSGSIGHSSPTSDSSVIVRGSGSIWDNSSSLHVGRFGDGTLLITDGGTVENSFANIADVSTSTGSVTVEGVGSTWTNTSSLGVGTFGNGTLNISGGATVSNTTARISGSSSSNGTVNVSGGGSHWNNSSTLEVAASGTGELNITGGGSVSSSSGTIGAFSSANGTVNVEGAGSRWTTSSSLTVGDNGTGTLNVTNGGVFGSDANVTLGASGTGNGTVTVNGTGSRLDIGTTLSVGDLGTGSLIVGDGGAVDVSSGTTIGANGTLTFDGGSLKTTSLDNSGGGSLSFSSGTLTVDGGAFNPGAGAFSLEGNSTTTLNLKGTANSTISGDLAVANIVGSEAVLNLSENHTLNAINATIGSMGEVNLTGGTLAVTSLANTAGGTLNFSGGSIQLGGGMLNNGASLTVPSAGTLSGSGTVSSAVNGLVGSTITVSGGTMMLGDAASFLGFVHQGTLNVGANTVTLNSAGFAQLGGLTTLAGGTLSATNGIVLGAGDSLVATGTIQASVAASAGSQIIATGDLTMGSISSFDGFDSRGRLRTGEFHVTLQDRNRAQLGSLTELGGPDDFGPLGTPGQLSAANGLILDFSGGITGFGEVDTPNSALTPFTNNGSIAGESAVKMITLSGYVNGVGTLDNVIITGTDAPGFSPAAVNRGSVSYDGTLEIEIGGLTAGGQFDQVNHLLGAGIADLGGVLDVSLINGFAPTAGDSFDILTASGSIDNAFATVNLPSLSGGLAWNVNQGANILSLAVGLAGDYNGDGTVDAADYTVWRDNEGAPAGTLPNDADGGVIGAAQYSSWVANFGATASVSTSVPEPSGLALLAYMAMQLTSRRKRA